MKDKVILFDGRGLDNFYEFDDDRPDITGNPTNWYLADGAMTVNRYNAVTEYEYGDAHVHVEFNLPDMPEKSGQGKANSGLFIHGCYEIQILDSYGKETVADDDCGAIYKIAAPLVNACKAPGEWQSFDVFVRAAKLNEEGSVVKHAVMTVFLNGQLIHNNIELPRHCACGRYEKIVERGPVLLQDHFCPVSFRNIWVQPLD